MKISLISEGGILLCESPGILLVSINFSTLSAQFSFNGYLFLPSVLIYLDDLVSEL